MSFEITAGTVQNDNAEVAAKLDDLRWLVFRGKAGRDGVSPEINVTDSGGVLRIEVKDAKGTRTVDIDSWKGMRFTVPDGTKTIDKSAFFGCVGLMGVTIPNTVTTIENYAFAGCSSLHELYLPDSVEKVGYGVFQECRSLESLRLPVDCFLLDLDVGSESKLHTLGPEAGDYNIKLATGTESIKEYAFFGLPSLTSAVIPDSVTSIGDAAFQDCENLESVEIPNSITTIGQYAFGNCKSLTTIFIPESVETIDHGAFARCTGLVSATIQGRLTSISESLFRGCSALESVQFGVVGTAVETVEVAAFEGCTNANLVITVFSLGEYADDVITGIRAGATNATIIVKAAANTTYNGNSYSAGDTIKTSNP